jgi:hypothetical protein
MVGKNMMDLRDPTGKYHIKERIEAAHKGTSGWQEIFSSSTRSTKKVQPKAHVWEKFDNLVFAAGAYTPTRKFPHVPEPRLRDFFAPRPSRYS